MWSLTVRYFVGNIVGMQKYVHRRNHRMRFITVEICFRFWVGRTKWEIVLFRFHVGSTALKCMRNYNKLRTLWRIFMNSNSGMMPCINVIYLCLGPKKNTFLFHNLHCRTIFIICTRDSRVYISERTWIFNRRNTVNSAAFLKIIWKDFYV